MKKLFLSLVMIGSLHIEAGSKPPPPVEPATVIAVTTLAVSMYQHFSGGGGNQLDAIAKMLSAINQKLNIIKQQLDVLIEKVDEIDQKVEYRRQYEQIRSSMFLLNQDYSHLKDPIYQGRKGRKKFFETYSASMKTNLRKINECQYITSFYDPVTVSLMCVAIPTYYEFSKFVETPENDLNREMLHYYRYLQLAAWYAPNSLEKSIGAFKKEQQDIFKTENYKFKLEIFPKGMYEKSDKAYIELPVTDEMEKLAVEYAAINGLFTFPKGYLQYSRETIKRVDYYALGDDFIRAKDYDNFKKRIRQAPDKVNPQFERYHYQILQYCTAYLTAVETIKYLKPILNDFQISQGYHSQPSGN